MVDHLRMMNDLRIKKSILSISSPGTSVAPLTARKMTRYCNEFAASLKKDHPQSFGFWASLPLPDVQGSLKEIDYAFDTLDADGVVVMTNHEGRYPGDPIFAAVFAELDSRKAKVFVHPTTPCMTTASGRISATPFSDVPHPIFEFLFEDARGVMSLFLSGNIIKYPNITYIISHLGGAFHSMVERFSTVPGLIGMDVPGLDSEAVRKAIKQRFFWDLAGFPLPGQIHGVLPYVEADNLLYGSDYPYTPYEEAKKDAIEMDHEFPGLFNDTEDQQKIYCGNAEKLLGGTEDYQMVHL